MANTRRRSTSGARRRNQNATPGWVWAVAGLIVGLFIAFLVWLSGRNAQPAVEQPITVKETAMPPKIESKPVVAEKKKVEKKAAEKEPPKSSNLDFYNMLPKQTVDAPTNNYRSKETTGPGPLLQPTTEPAAEIGDVNTDERFILQAGSFRKLKDADKRRAQLALMGKESKIERVRVNDGYWHRVLLGPFNSLDAANRLRAQLHSQNIQTMLVNARK